VSRKPKVGLLVALLAGVAVCLRRLSLGNEAAWAPFLSDSSARLLVRFLMISMGVGAWFVSQSLISSRGLRDGAIGDAIHDWTAPLHDWFVRRPGPANVLLIASTVFIDLFGLFLLGSALFGPSVRPGIGLLLLFAFRQVSQALCALPTPPGMIWRRPGVPALFVTYDVANDFFFSGHTSVAVLGAIEIAKIAPSWVALAAVAIAILEGLTVLVLRAHYTMDVLTAAVAAFVAAELAAGLCVGF
jgi:hypothetical protein